MKSIVLKLWLGMVALVMVMLVLLWFFQTILLKPFYMKDQLAKIEKEGIFIADNWNTENEDVILGRLDKLYYEYKSTVEIIDKNGSLIYRTEYSNGHGKGQSPMMWRSGTQFNMLNNVMKGNLARESVVHPKLGTEFMILGIPMVSNNVVAGGLFITMPLAAVEQIGETLGKQLVYITPVLLLAALVLSYFISKVFTRPILDIDRAASQMASGNLSVRLKIKSKDELGRLTNTMNNLADQLTRVEQLRRDLIANVSHELRTPLSLIRGYAETIRDISGNVKEKRDRHVGVIIEESVRLSKIVDDILNLSQMQAGYLSLNIEKIQLSSILQNVTKRYDILGEKLQIKLVLKHLPDIFVLVDQGRIEQVLYNLINNAFNHTAHGDIITIAAENHINTVKVQISDTGEGIPQENIQYIWERYFKVDKSKDRKQIGTGLGLAIVKNILEAHKSKYGVNSEEGKGTTFWFELQKSD